jgi:FixJ family two-component response regulator
MKPNLIESTQNHSEFAHAGGCNGSRLSARGSPGTRPRSPENRTILLISDDATLGQHLRCVANTVGRIVVRVAGAADVSRIMYAVQPAVVLLDLDLPAEIAWAKADALLQEQSCPPVILLTARTDQFDVRTAIQAGSLVDKSADPMNLLGIVDHTLRVPASCQAERNAIQRVAIRWLRPCSWSVSLTPAYRFWGINE